MIRNILTMLLLAGASPLAAQVEASDSDFQVTDIEVRLLYEQSGRLSEDVTANSDFSLWNTIIGEGSAEENAHDLLVTAVVSGPGEHVSTTPLVISALDQRGRRIGARRMDDVFLDSRTYRSLVLYDVGCAGPLTLTAQFGASRRTEEVDLACGE